MQIIDQLFIIKLIQIFFKFKFFLIQIFFCLIDQKL